MRSTARITRVIGGLVFAALVWPAMPGGGAFCAHAAAAGLKKCCCDHSDGRGADIAGPMGCCRFEPPAATPRPPATPALDPQDRVPVAAELDHPEVRVPALAASAISGIASARSESPPGTLFLLNATFRI